MIVKLEFGILEKSELTNTLLGHTGGIISVVITSDGKYIVSGSIDKTIKIWEFKTG